MRAVETVRVYANRCGTKDATIAVEVEIERDKIWRHPRKDACGGK